MIAAELRGGNKPNLSDALGWIGSRVDDIYGAAVGRLEDVWIDPGTGTPRWLLVKEGRFNGRTTLIPFEDATAGAGHVWIPYEREAIRAAPEIEPGAPLTQQVESELREHFRAHAPAAVSHRGHTEPGGPAPTPLQPPPASPAEEAGPRLGAARPAPEPPRTPDPEPAPAPGPAPTPYRSYSEIPERPSEPERPPAPAPEPIPFGRPAGPQPEPGPPPLRAAEPPAPPAAPGPGWGEGAPRPILRPAPAPEPQPPPVETREPLPHEPPPATIRRSAPAASAPASSPGSEPDETASLPIVHGLDGPYRIELELEGGLRISGELRSLRILPLDEQ